MKNQIANFWIRIIAFAFDSFVLGIFGFCLGLLFNTFFVTLGAEGRLIGLAISLLYFTILNSQIGNGQTLGKKLFKIKVVRRSGEHLSVKSSLIRALVLTIPYFFLNYRIPGISDVSIINVFKLQFCIYTLLGLLLIYILNKYNRQSIHDLVVDSFVVDMAETEPELDIQKTKPYIFYIFGGIVCILLTLTILNISKPKKEKYSDLGEIHKELLEIDNIIHAAVSRNTNTFIMKDERTVSESLIGVLYLKEVPRNTSDLESLNAVKNAVLILFDMYSNMDEIDNLTIQVVRAYDIGIARASRSYSETKSPRDWYELYDIDNPTLKSRLKESNTNEDKIEYSPDNVLSSLHEHKLNANHTIYYNSEMPIEDVKVLGKAISKLSGYFPIDQEINFIFTNEDGEYYFKLFIQKKYWNESGAIERIKKTAEYIEGTGINKRIRVVFIDGWDLSEKEIK